MAEPKPEFSEPDQALNRMRGEIVNMCAGPEGGHLGGSMSVLEILTAIYTLSPTSVNEAGLPHVVLSKGHAAIALYAVLAEIGIIDPESLGTFCRPGSALSTHTNPQVPGVELATGSLGHGLGYAVGWAIETRSREERVYVVVGDGELQEGSVFEAARVAGHLELSNLVALVDTNGGQQTGTIVDISHVKEISSVWSGFGWNVLQIEDGNNYAEIYSVLKNLPLTKSGPTVIICHTTKGSGAGHLEGKASSHFVKLNEQNTSRILRRLNLNKPKEEANAY